MPRTERTSAPTRRRKGAVLLVGLGAAWLLGACAGEDEAGPATTAAPPSASGQVIEIENFAYKPPMLQVSPGAKVRVDNTDSAAHTVTADDGSFDTGNIGAGGKKEITAPGAGEIRYKCTIHQYMTGVIRIASS